MSTAACFHVAGFAGMVDVVLDHPLDALLAARRVDEIVAQFDGDHLGKMLMLGNGEDFVFGQFGQFDAVLNGQHGTPRVEILRFMINWRANPAAMY